MKQHAAKCKTRDINFAAGNQIPRECDCDGYHTFEELYDHRITLYITLCAILRLHTNLPIWRSKKHSDGTEWKGWFILGISEMKGRQITYHLPIERWDETTYALTYEQAPEWDGHTSDDVISRLKTL
jgi:hypothetical protein